MLNEDEVRTGLEKPTHFDQHRVLLGIEHKVQGRIFLFV